MQNFGQAKRISANTNSKSKFIPPSQAKTINFPIFPDITLHIAVKQYNLKKLQSQKLSVP